MAIYKVSCLDLQTKEETRKNIYDKLVAAMPNNSIEGIQRALFLFQHFGSDEIILPQPYSVIAYFHSNETSPGAMRFQREDRQWDQSKAEVKLRLD